MRRKQRKTFLLIFVVVVVFVSAVSARHVLNLNATSSSPGPPQIGPSQIVRFTIYGEGVRPAVGRVSPGWVVIYIDDKSQSSAGLTIQSELGITLGQVRRAANRLRGSTRMYLPVGQYRIFDASRMTHSATLIVAP